MLDVFPHVTLWTTELHEMLLLGSMEPMELDAIRIAERFADPDMVAALAAVGVSTPAALLATYITDRAGLETYVAGAPPVTDDRPRIEHAGWVRRGEFGRVLARTVSLRRAPPLHARMTHCVTPSKPSIAACSPSPHQASLGINTPAAAQQPNRFSGNVLAEDGDNPTIAGGSSARPDRSARSQPEGPQIPFSTR
jgi:spermidine synthase